MEVVRSLRGQTTEFLVEALTELTVAVGDVTHAVQALRSDVCARFPSAAVPYSAEP